MTLQPPNKAPSFFLQKMLSARLEDVSNKLADPLQMPTIHPVIYRTEITERRKEGSVEVLPFHVWEKAPLPLGLSIPIQYKAESRRDLSAPSVIVLEAWSQPRLHFFIHFSLTQTSPEQCEVKESTWLEAPWFMRSYMVKTVSSVHKEQLERLAASFLRG